MPQVDAPYPIGHLSLLTPGVAGVGCPLCRSFELQGALPKACPHILAARLDLLGDTEYRPGFGPVGAEDDDDDFDETPCLIDESELDPPAREYLQSEEWVLLSWWANDSAGPHGGTWTVYAAWPLAALRDTRPDDALRHFATWIAEEVDAGRLRAPWDDVSEGPVVEVLFPGVTAIRTVRVDLYCFRHIAEDWLHAGLRLAEIHTDDLEDYDLRPLAEVWTEAMGRSVRADTEALVTAFEEYAEAREWQIFGDMTSEGDYSELDLAGPQDLEAVEICVERFDAPDGCRSKPRVVRYVRSAAGWVIDDGVEQRRVGADSALIADLSSVLAEHCLGTEGHLILRGGFTESRVYRVQADWDDVADVLGHRPEGT